MPEEDWGQNDKPVAETWGESDKPAETWGQADPSAKGVKLSPWQAAWEGGKAAVKNQLGFTDDEANASGPADDALGIAGNLSEEAQNKMATPMTILSTLGRGFRTPLHTLLNPGAMYPQIMANTPDASTPFGRAALGSTVGLGTTILKNMFASPENAPSGPDIVQDVADRGQDAIHSLFHMPDSPRLNTRALTDAKVYDKEGNADWSRVPIKLLGHGIDMVSDIGTDPGQLALMGVHPGVSPEFARGTVAARDAVRMGEFGKFKTLQAAEDAMKGRLSDAVAAGQAGVNLKVPFGGPEIGFKQVIPKAFAPAFKALEPITDYLAKPLVGPNPSSPQELLKVKQEGLNRQKAMTFMRDNLAPVEQQVAKAGFTDETMLHNGAAVEAFDQDGNLHAKIEPENSPMDLKVQSGFPKELASDFEDLAKKRSDIHAEVKRQYEAGPEHFTPQVEAAFKHASTLTPAQQATFWDVAQQTAKVMHSTLRFMQENGLDVDTINAPVKALPRKLFDTIKSIEPEQFTSNKTINAFGTQVGDVALTSKVRPAVQALYEAVGKEGFNTNELGKMLDDVRFDKPPEKWQGTDMSRYERHTPADQRVEIEKPEILRTPDTLASELTTGRMKRQASAAQRVTGAVNEFESLKELNPAERQYLVNKLYEKLPQAMKQYNAVPGYRPGMITKFTREEMNAKQNPNLKRQGGAMNPEQAKRSGTLAGMDKQYGDMGDVRMTVSQGMEQYAKGTEATYGRALATAGNWWDRFMTKTGMREIQASGGREFFEPNALKAVRHQLEHPVARAITNEALDAEMLRLYDLVPDDLKETANRLLHDGVETGKAEEALPQYSHSKKGALLGDTSSRALGKPEPRPWRDGTTPPWDLKFEGPEHQKAQPGPNTHDPRAEHAYPGQARFQNMPWDELSKLAEEGNPAARHELTMRMEPLSGRSSGRPEIKPNRVAGVSSWEMGNAPPEPHDFTGRVFDPQNPFQQRPDPFAPPKTPTPLHDMVDRLGEIPAPTKGYFNEVREGPGKPAAPEKPAAAPQPPRAPKPTSQWDPTQYDPFQHGRKTLEQMEWKELGQKARDGNTAAQAEMIRRTEPRTFKTGADVSIEVHGKRTRLPDRKVADESTLVPKQATKFNPEQGPLPEGPRFVEGPQPEPFRIKGEPVKYRGQTQEVSTTRPTTLADMEELWKKSGRTDKFADHLNDTAKEALKSGKTLQEAVGSQWQPADRAYVELGDQKGWIHTGVANDLANYKRLGSDPTTFTNFLRRNVPAYVQFVKMAKAVSTLWGPGAPGYVALKTAHDLVRGEIAGAWDMKSAGEIANGQAGHWRYADTGGMDVSGIPEYDFGPKYGRLGGAQAAELLERNRALGTSGEVAQEFQRGATEASRAAATPDSSLDLGDYGTPKISDLPNAGRKMENFIRGQDNGMRSAAFASYLRQGMTEGEAAFQVERAFFDFTRKGTIPQILGQSGIVPFAAWHFKIIPFMLNWAMKNPGEFMLVQRVLGEMGAGAIPPSQVPMYIQHGTNIPVSVWKDEHGHVQMGMLTDDGVVPGDELRHLASSPLNFTLSKAGPPLRALFVASEQAKMDAKDPEKTTWGDWAKKYGQAATGRPTTIIKTLADPSKTAGEKLSMVFNPMQYQVFDATKQSQISAASAQRNVKYANYAVTDANKAVRAAEAKASDKTKTMSQVEALQFLQSDPTYIDAMNQLSAAQARVQREKIERKKNQNDVKQAKKVRDQMILAP